MLKYFQTLYNIHMSQCKNQNKNENKKAARNQTKQLEEMWQQLLF